MFQQVSENKFIQEEIKQITIIERKYLYVPDLDKIIDNQKKKVDRLKKEKDILWDEYYYKEKRIDNFIFEMFRQKSFKKLNEEYKKLFSEYEKAVNLFWAEDSFLDILRRGRDNILYLGYVLEKDKYYIDSTKNKKFELKNAYEIIDYVIELKLSDETYQIPQIFETYEDAMGLIKKNFDIRLLKV